ncbi:Transportin-1 [Choanephora cucurbitarum]|uniref:Transportin-1 n=1 Tax=Choanephora cucurbitarum TaxID=101091 RepID=A0A1C7N573_9FUNG|nr:Transportin-1 [Choanephora cucurbitarum]
MEWQPQPQGLRELMLILNDASDPNYRDQALVNQRLYLFNQYPDYNAYLVYIVTKLTPENLQLCKTAGSQLKNNLRNNFHMIPSTVLDYVKQCCIDVLNHPNSDMVGKTISSLISIILQRGQMIDWPEIIPLLIEKLDDSNQRIVETAFDTIYMICEDLAPELDQEIDGVRPLATLLHKLTQFYSSPDVRFRIQALNATSQFVSLKPVSFVQQLDLILANLYQSVADTHPRVLHEFGRILTHLLEVFPEKLEPYFDDTIQYMINALSDNDREIALGACDFWTLYAQSSHYQHSPTHRLPEVAQGLLRLMVYSDLELFELQDEESMPHYSFQACSSKHAPLPLRQELSDPEEDSDTTSVDNQSESSFSQQDDFDDDDFYSQDSLRKCSAAALDALSVTFQDDFVVCVLDHLLKHVLVHPEWLIRESGILAIGATAEGQYLDKLIPFLLHSVQDSKSLIRSISCWAISRFSHWLVNKYDEDEQGRQLFFEPVLSALLSRLLDTNKRVQEAACTAFIVLEEHASFRLIPYIQPILFYLNQASDLYGRKNRSRLYDALGTFAMAVGTELNRPENICLLMPPLIEKWNTLSDKDTDLFPLLECLSNITTALGPGFIQYVDPVLSRCTKLISSTLQEQVLADQYPDEMMPPNVEFLIAALGLVSGIVRGLGPKIEPLITETNSPLLVLLRQCIHDPVSEVLQATCALIGDIAIASFDVLVPCLHDLIVEIMDILLHHQDCMLSISVYNNALWALGEMVMRWGNDAHPYVFGLLKVCIPFLTHPQSPASVKENAMVALGRLGLASPQYVASHMKMFVRPWLKKSMSVRDGEEKDTSFQGLCAMIKFNPLDVQDELCLLWTAMASVQDPSHELINAFSEIVSGFHHLLEEKRWNDILSQLNDDTQKTILDLLERNPNYKFVNKLLV